MKRLLYAISLVISIVVFSLGMLKGVRLLPAVGRSLIAFFTTYAGGLVVAMVFFTTYYSQTKKKKDMGEEVKKISNNKEAA